jgi:hypothetical protein
VTTPPPTCVHHWLLSRPGPNASTGVCTHCGATRDFTGANKSSSFGRSAPKRELPLRGA